MSETVSAAQVAFYRALGTAILGAGVIASALFLYLTLAGSGPSPWAIVLAGTAEIAIVLGIIVQGSRDARSLTNRSEETSQPRFERGSRAWFVALFFSGMALAFVFLATGNDWFMIPAPTVAFAGAFVFLYGRRVRDRS